MARALFARDSRPRLALDRKQRRARRRALFKGVQEVPCPSVTLACALHGEDAAAVGAVAKEWLLALAVHADGTSEEAATVARFLSARRARWRASLG
jgi:hypothetical protein